MIDPEEEKNFLSELKEDLRKINNIEASLNSLLKQICTYTGWDYGEAWLPGKSGEQLKYASAWSSNKNQFEEFRKFSSICKFAKGIGLVGKTWEKRKPLRDDRLSIKSDFQRYDVARKAGISSGISFFISLKDNTPLVLIFFLIKEGPEDKRYCEFISGITDEIGKILNY